MDATTEYDWTDSILLPVALAPRVADAIRRVMEARS